MAESSRAAQLSVLEQIIVRKRAELVAERALVDIADLERRRRPLRRSFRKALESNRPAIIAEIKKASPSAGVIAADFHPADIAASYQAGGAAALSVLTDQQFFAGSLDHLVQARAATRLPVLRKDFTLDRYHLLQASDAGADAVLLIVAALSDDELQELLEQARELELDALVEVHDEAELDRALAVGANLIGVNNRNLKTLEVSLETSLRLAERIPAAVLAVSESGIRRPADIRRLMEAGYQAFLIGESLMRTPDPGSALAELIAGAMASQGE
jgi:indole-3-glycerol phosphate synthase